MVNLGSGIGGKRRQEAQGLTLHDLLEQLRTEKPVNYRRVILDATTARDNEEVVVSGDFLAILSEPSAVRFTLRLNEKTNEPLNTSRYHAILAPFYRLFVTNVVGAGHLELLAGQGFSIQPRAYPIESDIAARPIDGRGEVVWHDDFEDGIIKWAATSAGASASVAAYTSLARNGAKSALLRAGSDGDAYAQIAHSHVVYTPQRIGYEISFVFTSGMAEFEHRIQEEDSGTLYHAAVRYDVANTALDVEHTALGTWAEVTSIALGGAETLFHTIKLVVDMVTKRYVRVVLDDIEYNLRAWSMISGASPGGDYIQLVARNNGDAAATRDALVDDAILTKNEP